jgi:predicted dehydrogenase
MRDCMKSGEIGELRSVQATLAYNNMNPNDIRNKADIGGGALYDIGSYAIAGCRYVFAEEPVRVVATLDRDPTFKIDRLTTAILAFPQGHASFTVSTQGWPDTGGTHRISPFSDREAGSARSFPFPMPCRRTAVCSSGMTRASAPNQRARSCSGVEPVRPARRTVFSPRPWRGRRAVPLEGAIANMRVIDAVFRSGQTGNWEQV